MEGVVEAMASEPPSRLMKNLGEGLKVFRKEICISEYERVEKSIAMFILDSSVEMQAGRV